jgi:hypothetical protein
MNQLNNHGSSLPHHRLLAYQKSLELLAAAAVAPRRDLLREDLIQIEFGNGVVLDVGWYPEFSSDGAFGLVVIDVGDERRMLLALTSKPTVFFSHSAQDAEARHRRHRPSDHGQTRLHLVEDDRWQIGQDKQTLLRRR